MTAAETSSRPVHSQGLLLIAITVGVLVLAVYLTQSILENENGGISATVRTAGICLAIWAFVRPKAGLYIITAEAFSVDFIKKVAVYYGTASMGTIIEVLVVTMLAVLGTIGGVLIQSVALRRYKLPKLSWIILAASTALCVAILLATRVSLGFEKAAENAFNGAVFIALAVPMSVFLTDRDELNKLLKLQFWLVVLWALWGIKQYYYGFSQLEWFYAETGLSFVSSEHMLRFAVPRPFGLGSGAPNYGVISPYVALGVWYCWHQRRKRLVYILGTAVVFWGLVTSLQRTALIFPFIVPLFYYCFLNRQRTITIYATGIVLFIAGVAAADYLYAHLSDINSFISVRGYWGENVLNVSTFSERLFSWMQLKDPSIWSVFGLNEDLGSHDVFSKIVISYGAFGLLMVLGGGGLLSWFLHRTLLRVEDPDDRRFATFLMAATVPMVALGFAGGGNFTTNPTNLQIWTFFGAAVSLVIHSKLADPVVKPTLASVRAMLAQQEEERRPMALGGSRPGMARG